MNRNILKISRRLPALLLAISTLVSSLTLTASAHTVWIEPDHDRLVIRFAEPGDDFETSPGYLDNLSGPVAFSVLTNTPVAIESPKKADHFSLDAVAPTNVVCVESSFTVRGGRKPVFYARWQPAGASTGTPLLTLDLVPTGKAGEVRAYFRGQPLGGIKAALRSPDQKVQDLTADAEGFLHFTAKQPGQYLLTIAHHRESLAGFHAGHPYEQTSHNTALTWREP